MYRLKAYMPDSREKGNDTYVWCECEDTAPEHSRREGVKSSREARTPHDSRVTKGDRPCAPLCRDELRQRLLATAASSSSSEVPALGPGLVHGDGASFELGFVEGIDRGLGL